MRYLMVVLGLLLLVGCAPKEKEPPTDPGASPGAGAPAASAASQNGGAAYGPDGKPLTGVGK